MARHLLVVLLSALIGSTLGTAIWFFLQGGTGASEPIRSLTGFAAGTLMFTVPGAVILMGATFVFADRNLSLSQAAYLTVAIGTLLGAGMMGLIAPTLTAAGAIFGGLTALAFVSLLKLIGAYPGRT